MNINNTQQNLSFGQLVPTRELLKTALGSQTYDDSKLLYCSVSNKFPGHTGFHKQAVKIADNIIQKNPKLQEIINEIKNGSQHTQTQRINSLVKSLGEQIDVII